MFVTSNWQWFYLLKRSRKKTIEIDEKIDAGGGRSGSLGTQMSKWINRINKCKEKLTRAKRNSKRPFSKNKILTTLVELPFLSILSSSSFLIAPNGTL